MTAEVEEELSWTAADDYVITSWLACEELLSPSSLVPSIFKMLVSVVVALIPLLAQAAPVLNGSSAPPPPSGGVDTSAFATFLSLQIGYILQIADPFSFPPQTLRHLLLSTPLRTTLTSRVLPSRCIRSGSSAFRSSRSFLSLCSLSDLSLFPTSF